MTLAQEKQEDREARWRISLHESAHAVAAEVLLKAEGISAILLEKGGMTYYKRALPLMPFPTFDEILQTATGGAAEMLAEVYDPPVPSPRCRPRSSQNSTPEMKAKYAEAARDQKTTESDAEKIAKYCILADFSDPDRWRSRYVRIHYEASFFVRNNAQAILKVARELFLTGTFTGGKNE